MDLKHIASLDNTLRFGDKWLNSFLPEYSIPCCTNIKFLEGECQLYLEHVFKSWISELDWNRPLFLLPKRSKKECIEMEVKVFVNVWKVDDMNHDYHNL